MQHEPYKYLLAALRAINAIDDDDEFEQVLYNTREYVRELRTAYRSSPAQIDYSCPNRKAAYLIAYYPHYIEPLFYTLSKIPPEHLSETIRNNKARGCFIGSGPAPEVLGWIRYLNDFSLTLRKGWRSYLTLSHGKQVVT